MKTTLQELVKLKIFFLSSFVVLLLGLVIILVNDKVYFHLFLNQLHSPILDQFFKNITHLGDGLLTAIAIVPLGILAYRKFKYSSFILGGLTLFLTGLLAQLLKRTIFPGTERPLKYIGDHILYLVPDVEVHSMNSFPSGHTATAFAFFAFVAFIFFKSSRIMQVVCVLLAVLVAYSRIYLSQHFLEDTVMGAIVGLLSFFLAFIIVTKLPVPSLSSN